MLLSELQKKKKSIWKDPAGEQGVRTTVSTRYYLSFGLLFSRKGVCESISGAYERTSTDGKFLFHKASKLSQRGRLRFSPLLKKCLMSYALFLSAPTTIPPTFLQCHLAFLQSPPSFSVSLSFFLLLSLAPTLMTLAPPCTCSSSAGFKWWAENITEFKWWFWMLISSVFLFRHLQSTDNNLLSIYHVTVCVVLRDRQTWTWVYH